MPDLNGSCLSHARGGDCVLADFPRPPARDRTPSAPFRPNCDRALRLNTPVPGRSCIARFWRVPPSGAVIRSRGDLLRCPGFQHPIRLSRPLPRRAASPPEFDEPGYTLQRHRLLAELPHRLVADSAASMSRPAKAPGTPFSIKACRGRPANRSGCSTSAASQPHVLRATVALGFPLGPRQLPDGCWCAQQPAVI